MDFNWEKVWFSDETCININRYSTPVWHKIKNRPTVSKPKFSAKIMCWGAISYTKKSKLVVVHGTLNATRYIEILKVNFFHENKTNQFKNFYFQQDNTTSHKAKMTSEFFASNRISILPWPPNSPDLNPIENLWQFLKQRVKKRQPKSLDELKNIAIDEWEKIDQKIISKAVSTVGKRIQQVLTRQGKKCDY